MLAAKQGPLQVRDVVLYRHPAGEYVLHRVVKVLDGAYLIRGDNCIGSETVPAAWVIGVMTGYLPTRETATSPATARSTKTTCARWSCAGGCSGCAPLPGRVWRRIRRARR